MESGTAPDPIRPGAITALMVELAREPARPGWGRPLLPGERVGRFEIVREIGRGGFGVVHEARDLVLGRSVAFKAMRPRATGPASLEEEADALAEAEAAAHLAHPNIVHLYDAQRCDDGPYLIMELLSGRTLADRLVEGPLPLAEALHVAVEAARGLAHAHAFGVVHRDLKPSNVFLCQDGQVKVLDFGLARVFGRETTSGGTPGYMAPEQRQGRQVDERSDVYGLGVVIEEMVTGKGPEVPPSEAPAAAGEPISAPAPAAPASEARLTGALADLVLRMKAQDPGARPSSGEEVYQALLEVERVLQPRRRPWLAWSVAGLAAAAAVTAAAWPRPEPLPPGRLAVAVADAANASGDASLDGADVLLAGALEQSPRASVLSRAQLARAAGLAPGDPGVRLEGGAALRAARAAGAHVLLSLAIRPDARGNELEARGVDPRHDRPLFTIRERSAGAQGFLDALDRVAERVRRELREDAASAPPPLRLAQVISPNPEARAAYAEGQQLTARGRPRHEAIAAYERAVAADPEFPLPRVMLALAWSFGDRAAAERHLEAALAHPERVPPRERRLVEAASAMVRFDFARAMERFDQVIAGWPDDPEAYRMAATLASEWYGDPELARPYLERLLAIGASGPSEEIGALERLGRLDEALARARERAEANPGRGTLTRLARFHRVRGERAEALAAGRLALSHASATPPVAAGPDPPAGSTNGSLLWTFAEGDALDELQAAFDREGVHTHWILGLRGRRREALAVFDATAPPASAPSAVRGYFHNRRADLVAGFADVAAVQREVEAQLLLGVPSVLCSTVILAWAGDLEGADRLQRLWPMRDPRSPCTRLHQAMRSFRLGEPEAALRALSGLDWAASSFHRGEVLLAAGRLREAVDELRRYRRSPSRFDGTDFGLFAWPRSLYLEALALERSGDREQARAVVGRLLRLWSRADRDLPTLREARALRARLGGPEAG